MTKDHHHQADEILALGQRGQALAGALFNLTRARLCEECGLLKLLEIIAEIESNAPRLPVSYATATTGKMRR